MRLIDADELKETIGKYEFNSPNERYKQGGECVLNFYMPKIIDDAPTIEAEPVRHGEWKHVAGMNIKCSECGRYFPVKEFDSRPFDINYCPNCGAKMEGGVSDETIHDKK